MWNCHLLHYLLLNLVAISPTDVIVLLALFPLTCYSVS
uniref:Uncharacterized protein n=1 Tax=Rhizophora mucronata TaxID=61149 RepID=A0A2P2QDS2_RHIMU